MRIIQIIDVRWFNASADFAVTQAASLAGKGHEVLVMANPNSPPAREASKIGLMVFEEIDFSSPIIPRTAVKLREAARRFRPDIIFAHRGESHLAAALAARNSSFKTARFRGDVRPPRRGFFSRILNEKMTAGIAVSTDRLKQEYRSRYNLNGIPLQVIYPGIDCSRFHNDISKEDLKRRFGFNPSSPVVGIVGRLSPVKGHEYFLKAAGLVGQSRPDVQFVVAGGDAQLSTAGLRSDAAAQGIGNIKFLGLIDNVDALISSFDIGVVASTGSEMICRVLLEYFAAGLPVVATEINQVAEIMALSSGGITVPPADAEAMAAALSSLLDDDVRRERFALRARNWVKSGRTLDNLARETEDFLRRVIDE